MVVNLKYVVFVSLLLACHTSPRNADAAKITHELLDTVKIIPSTLVASPEIFEKAYVKGTTQPVNRSTLYFYGINMGKLKISSGHIIACDPTLIGEYGIPFTQVFPTGDFPVQLSIAKLDNEESIAFARISFSEEPVVRWDAAQRRGENTASPRNQEAKGYIVDGGIGCFVDEESKKALNIDSVADLNSDLLKEMNRHYHHKWKYALYRFEDYNLAAFSAGFGEGNYSTYIGFDATGKPCRLLTDFGFVNWQKK